MSEYQYYEFQAVDRPLTDAEMRQLRAVSARAEITASGFVNFYTWGDFKGNPSAWMERYFDGFLYLANWGTHELMLRLPRELLAAETAPRRYCRGDSARARAAGDFTILDFCSEDEEAEDVDDGSGWLAKVLPLRAEIGSGDRRALYLAWLLCVQNEETNEEDPAPPVPAGPGKPSTALRALAAFLRIDRHLIATAAMRSADLDDEVPVEETQRWVGTLPEDEKDLRALAARAGRGSAADVRIESLRQTHVGKSAFIDRLDRVGLTRPSL